MPNRILKGVAIPLHHGALSPSTTRVVPMISCVARHAGGAESLCSKARAGDCTLRCATCWQAPP
jgi:hypothetical protein